MESHLRVRGKANKSAFAGMCPRCRFFAIFDFSQNHSHHSGRIFQLVSAGKVLSVEVHMVVLGSAVFTSNAIAWDHPGAGVPALIRNRTRKRNSRAISSISCTRCRMWPSWSLLSSVIPPWASSLRRSDSDTLVSGGFTNSPSRYWCSGPKTAAAIFLKNPRKNPERIRKNPGQTKMTLTQYGYHDRGPCVHKGHLRLSYISLHFYVLHFYISCPTFLVGIVNQIVPSVCTSAQLSSNC
jgi:hypothetical protein